MAGPAGTGVGRAVVATILTASEVMRSLKGVTMLIGYLTLVTAVCLLSWIVPTKRALRVQPMEALRTDG